PGLLRRRGARRTARPAASPPFRPPRLETPMTRRSLAILIAAAAACAAVTAGCGADDEPQGGGDERVQVILDWSPNADHAGIFGAIGEDYFAEEGLDVRPTVPRDPAAALKQVGAGRAPFAVSYEPEVLIARSQG